MGELLFGTVAPHRSTQSGRMRTDVRSREWAGRRPAHRRWAALGPGAARATVTAYRSGIPRTPTRSAWMSGCVPSRLNE